MSFRLTSSRRTSANLWLRKFLVYECGLSGYLSAILLSLLPRYHIYASINVQIAGANMLIWFWMYYGNFFFFFFATHVHLFYRFLFFDHRQAHANGSRQYTVKFSIIRRDVSFADADHRGFALCSSTLTKRWHNEVRQKGGGRLGRTEGLLQTPLHVA